jgi:hypothetical protein
MADYVTVQHPLTSAEAGAPLKFALKVKREAYALLFKRKHWNDIVRASLETAGWFWIRDFLPLRFTAYARNVGIYTGGKPRGLPLVKSGRLRGNVMSRSRARAKATEGNAYIDLIVVKGQAKHNTASGRPFNYDSSPIIRQTLGSITARELRMMTTVLETELQSYIDGAFSRTVKRGPNKGQQRMSLRPAQREQIRQQRAQRFNYRPKGRAA